MKRRRRVNNILEHPTWQELKNQMRFKYVSERYQKEQLTKCFTLRQGSKSVEEYHDEFQNMTMKIDYEEDLHHAKALFRGRLNYGIVSKMLIHNFGTMDKVVDGAIEIERENKAGKSFNPKGYLYSTSWNKNKEVVQSSSVIRAKTSRRPLTRSLL